MYIFFFFLFIFSFYSVSFFFWDFSTELNSVLGMEVYPLGESLDRPWSLASFALSSIIS